MIRVLHLVSSLSVGSGLMSVIMNYYRHIDRSSYQFGFVYFRNVVGDTYEEEIMQLGGEIYQIGIPTLSASYKRTLNEFFSSLNNRYSILHVHELYLLFMFNTPARKHGIKGIVGHAHTTKFSDNLIPSIRNRIMCLGIKHKCDYKIACSNAAAQTYFGKGIVHKNDFQVLFNAIELQRYKYDICKRNKYRKELGLEDGCFLIGNVGRLNPQKNQLFLLDCFNSCLNMNSNCRLVIVGSGPLKNEIISKIKTLGIEQKVILLDKRNDLQDLYNAFDVFCLPSLFEGLGIVLIEAQANGLPCIVSSVVPDEAHVLPNYNELSLGESTDCWGECIIKANNMRMEEPIKLLEEAGYEISKASQSLENIYKQVLEET